MMTKSKFPRFEKLRADVPETLTYVFTDRDGVWEDDFQSDTVLRAYDLIRADVDIRLV